MGPATRKAIIGFCALPLVAASPFPDSDAAAAGRTHDFYIGGRANWGGQDPYDPAIMDGFARNCRESIYFDMQAYGYCNNPVAYKGCGRQNSWKIGNCVGGEWKEKPKGTWVGNMIDTLDGRAIGDCWTDEKTWATKSWGAVDCLFNSKVHCVSYDWAATICTGHF